MNSSILKALLVLGVSIMCARGRAAEPMITNEAIEGVECLPVEIAVLTDAPNVPPPITRRHPAKVMVNLEVIELTKRLADGVDYVFWTFGGSVPGKFIRIREGDEVEFHLNNHQDNKMPHNIDLHAVTGPGGGAASSFTAPGHSSQFSFLALRAGAYVYHCASEPVGMHIGNGMYGMILVEPTEGLPPVDREYYLMQGEFYTTGKYGEEGLQGFDIDKAIDERPPYVVFNGAVGSMVGDKALTAKVGERIRLYVGNGGPNLTSSFHVIGEIFDTVYPEGCVSPAQHNVQTTSIPPGAAAIVEFKAEVPGTYALVDHAIFRAFNKGAVGQIKVEGPPNSGIYSGKQADSVYTGNALPAPSEIVRAVAVTKTEPAKETGGSTNLLVLNEGPQMQKGRAVYMKTCFVCHQPNGQGMAGQFPPLAKSDFLGGLSKEDYIRGVLLGRTGKIVVNGKPYNGTMIPFANLSDEQIADVLSYVRNSFGNSGEAVTAEEVARIRAQAPPSIASKYD